MPVDDDCLSVYPYPQSWATTTPHSDSMNLNILETYINQLVKFSKEYPYPNDFFNTAVGFSRSTLLQAKGKKH